MKTAPHGLSYSFEKLRANRTENGEGRRLSALPLLYIRVSGSKYPSKRNCETRYWSDSSKSKRNWRSLSYGGLPNNTGGVSCWCNNPSRIYRTYNHLAGGVSQAPFSKLRCREILKGGLLSEEVIQGTHLQSVPSLSNTIFISKVVSIPSGIAL